MPSVLTCAGGCRCSSLRGGVEQGRPWFGPMVEALFGMVAWLRGEFAAAGSHLEAATAGRAAADQHEIEAVWFSPSDPIATRTSTWPWSASCAAISPAPRPSWGTRRAGPNSSASPRVPRLHALHGGLGVHRGRSALPCRGPVRGRERAGRAARLRHVAAGGGHLAGYRWRPGCTRCRRPRPRWRPTSRP
jgi:hypothetical protein